MVIIPMYFTEVVGVKETKEIKNTNQMKFMEMTLMPREKKSRSVPPRPDLSLTDVCIDAVGFLAARAVPLPGIAPFGLAFLTMHRRFSLQSLLAALMVVLGSLSAGGWQMARYAGACLIYEVFLFFLDRKEELSLRSALFSAAALVVLVDLGMMLWTGFSASGFILAALDLGITAMSVLAFDRGRSILSGQNILTRVPDNEEKLSLCVLAGILLLSFQNLPFAGYFSAANVLGLLLAGAAAVSGGVLSAAVLGMGTGLLLGIQGGLFPYLAVFSVCSMVSGFCAKKGKYPAAAGLAASGICLTLYYTLSDPYPVVHIYEAAAAAGILALLPDQVFAVLRRFTGFPLSGSDVDQPYKEHVQAKLALAAASFQSLADTFVQLSDTQDQADQHEIAVLFDTAVNRVCRSCPRASDCWDRNFNDSYKTLFRFLEIMERKGSLTAADADSRFTAKCLHAETMIREMNRLFEVYKINQVWKTKLCENRELVSQQFRGVSRIFTSISEELAQDAVFDQLAAEELRCRMKAKEIPVLHVSVMRTPEGKKSVRMSITAQHLKAARLGAPAVLKSVLGTAFVFAGATPSENTDSVTLRFQEAPRLSISAGFACAGKPGEDGESGDSHMLNTLRGGKFIATLSDGMGTGRRAGRESGAIVHLLEEFMDAGFDKTVAVRLINSAMVMKSAGEAFATVDMCMIDLYTGEAEFIKNGAEPSYIKCGGKTETIRAASLPVGIISDVEIETFAHTLNPGDTIVMVSDGLEVRGDGKDGWIRQTVENAGGDVPVRELADRIMDKAVTLKGGQADDDMTVIVLRAVAQTR